MRSAFVLLALAAATTGVRADPAARSPEAAAHLQRGLDDYARGDYDAAIEEFEQGLRLDPDPALHYAFGQAERKRGRCTEALVHYRAFVAAQPPEAQRRAAELQIARCEQELAVRAAEARKPAPMWLAVPWYRDYLGDAFLAGGLATAAIGLYVALDARYDLEHAGDSYAAYSAARSAPERRTAGFITIAAGAALVGFGGLHLALWRPHQVIYLEPVARGAMVSLQAPY